MNKPYSSDEMKYIASVIRNKPAKTGGIAQSKFLFWSDDSLFVAFVGSFGFVNTRMMLLTKRIIIITRVQGPFAKSLKETSLNATK